MKKKKVNRTLLLVIIFKAGIHYRRATQNRKKKIWEAGIPGGRHILSSILIIVLLQCGLLTNC